MCSQASGMGQRSGLPRTRCATAVLCAASAASAATYAQSPAALPDYLRDRGAGVPTSRPGTYVGAGEWLAEPYLTYSSNKDFEYDPTDLGFPSAQASLKGNYHATEARLFAAYGLSDRVALELDAGAIDASLKKAPEDLSGMPPKLSESGLGQIRARISWQWMVESEHRPELFSYAEVVVPHDTRQSLTGTSDWVFNGGLGVIRGFRWGTMTARIGLEYDTASQSQIDFHYYAIEYQRRVSPHFSLFLGYVVFEGDEAYIETELLWAPNPNVVVRLGNRLGVVSSALSATSNSAEYIPTLGVIIRFPGH